MIDEAVVTGILREAEERREALVSLCRNLVAARSVNPPGDTREVAAVVTDALRTESIVGRNVALRPDMPSVIARLDSPRPGRHLVVNVHMDTMPPGDESLWSVSPWELTRRDGRLYGLGMGNMKGAVAAMIHAVGMLQARADLWCGSISFTAVSDEVVFGDHGAAHLLNSEPDLLGDGMICGEGAGFKRLAVGEKGVLWLEVTVTADGGHSSSVQSGASASAKIARAVTAIESLTGQLGELPVGMTLAEPEHAAGLTANVGTVTSGTFIGQVSTIARAEIDVRLPPGISADDAQARVLAAVQGAVPDGSATVRRIKGWDSNVTRTDTPIVQSWRRAEGRAGFTPAELAIRLPASDASRWRAHGVPAICFGPQPTYSAGVDDYAEEDEVVRCAALYALTALDFLSAEEGTDGIG